MGLAMTFQTLLKPAQEFLDVITGRKEVLAVKQEQKSLELQPVLETELAVLIEKFEADEAATLADRHGKRYEAEMTLNNLCHKIVDNNPAYFSLDQLLSRRVANVAHKLIATAKKKELKSDDFIAIATVARPAAFLYRAYAEKFSDFSIQNLELVDNVTPWEDKEENLASAEGEYFFGPSTGIKPDRECRFLMVHADEKGAVWYAERYKGDHDSVLDKFRSDIQKKFDRSEDGDELKALEKTSKALEKFDEGAQAWLQYRKPGFQAVMTVA